MPIAIIVLGATLLIINVCCYIAFFRKYMDLKRGGKKPVNYQSYMSHVPPASEVNYIPNAPINQQVKNSYLQRVFHNFLTNIAFHIHYH